MKDYAKYTRLPGAEETNLINTYPCINDSSSTTSFDSHYFYQDNWAFGRISKSQTKYHVDIGSRIDFVGFLTTVTNVIFIDIRPLMAKLDQFQSIRSTILSLPFKNDSLNSLSCLHVIEHIGLGRYGDALNPSGTKEAAKELARVLAPGGKLYFSLPIGRPRLCFNAHRIHSIEQIKSYFSSLELIKLSVIDDEGEFIKDADEHESDDYDYGCGLFIFSKI